MTPEQIQALKAHIAASPDLQQPATLDGAYEIARLLNLPDGTAIRSRFITARTVLAEIGPDGATILDKLEAAAAVIPAVKWAMRFIVQDSGIDIGHPGTQGMTDQLVAGGILTAEEGAALKGLALQPVTRAERLIGTSVTPQDIEEARRAD